MNITFGLLGCFVVGCGTPPTSSSTSFGLGAKSLAVEGLSLSRVRLLPDRPSPYLLRDWAKVAKDYDRLAFDAQAKGPYLPLIWQVGSGFGMPSYVGNESQRGKAGEGICQLGALLGATAVKIDKSPWLDPSLMFWNRQEGVVLNNPDGKTGSSFWYDVLPSVVFCQIAGRYPKWHQGQKVTRSIADAWIGGIRKLDGNFDHTSFSLATGKPVDNKQWIEPDAAGGIAYIELSEALKTNDARYMKASQTALDALEKRANNPTYEVLAPFGALTAAYLNAHKGAQYNTAQFVDWCLEPTAPQRPGWGMVVGKWGGLDTGGLIGSTTDGGGYAFTMNTFVSLGALAPVARYDSRLSSDLAKWILNAANAARYFYSDALPDDHQSTPEWKADLSHCVAYEGLHKSVEGKAPFATGDAKRGGWSKTDFGLYGSGYVGLLGALVKETDVPMVLDIDLNATDFLQTPSYPTSLYWNPYEESKRVTVDLGSSRARLYDPVAHRFLIQNPVTGKVQISLAAKQAVQVVRVPATGVLTTAGNMALVNGIPVDFNYRNGLPGRKIVVVQDHSRPVKVGRAKVSIGGEVDWSASASDEVVLTGSNGSVMKASLKFAWDDQFLYFRVLQMTPSTQVIEAPTAAELEKHWWDFEDLFLDFDPIRNHFSPATVPGINVGWSSNWAVNLAFSSDLPADGFSVLTRGTSDSHSRAIFGKLKWSALDDAFGVKSDWRKPGAALGCQPLLVDGTFKRQGYIGGAQYTRPTGYDENSRTLVLGGD